MIRWVTWGVIFTTVLFFGGMVLEVEAQTGQVYVIQVDDTLWRLAEKYLGDGNRYPDIVQATRSMRTTDSGFAQISDPNVIHAGDQIWVPSSATAKTVLPDKDKSERDPVPHSGTEENNNRAVISSLSGQLAFSFWNNAPDRCTYEINIINVADCAIDPNMCQSNRRVFALNNASEPALSADGTRLAFRGWGAIPEKYKDGQLDHPYYGCPGPFSDRLLGHTSLEGTDFYRSTGFWEDSHPDWSPDGTRLLFDTARLGDGVTRIMTVARDGTYEETLRISGQHPSWAPDNDRFVYRGCDVTGNRCGLWLARALPVEAWDLGLNMLGPLLDDPVAAHPDWSPVGGKIVYQSSVTGNWDLYLINEDGTGERQLTTDSGVEGLPVWSPDGNWIAYLSDSGGNWGVWVIRPDGSEKQQLFPFDGGTFSPLAVPPYGARDWLDEQLSWSR
jgi:hypothetical protein